MTMTDRSPLLPPDAPFAPEQRRFVEGFVAGLLSVRAAQQRAAAPAGDAPGAPLVILYGSQSGNAESLAKQLRKVGRAHGFAPTVAALDGFDRDTLPEVRHLLIVCSTFGEGDPPDNAKQFYDWLLSDDAPALPDLSYAVCALGDRSYTHFCKAGLDLDRRLAELRATRLADCVTCDVDYDEDYEQWRDAVFASETMVEAAGEAPSVVAADDTDDAEEADASATTWSKRRPFPATLLRRRLLNGPGSAKEVNHLELSLAGSGLEYEVGDALGVWPTNCDREVEAILDAVGLTGEELVTLKGEAMPLRLALLTRLDLHVLTPGSLETLGLTLPADELNDRHLLDVLGSDSGIDPDPQRLVDALRPLQPRLYSIASSPAAHPGQVHLTVAAVRYRLRDRDCTGIASCWFADRLRPGATVPVYVQKSAHFHLPDDDGTDLIMVGPGTGIAPFRAFLEEREHRGAAGRHWLLFGDQHEACDFLYRDELLAMRDRGVLHRLDLAWSRDGASKVYVQHRMREAGAELFRWLEDGAHFYVCGDASRMAKDVDAELRAIVAEHGNMSDDEAAAYVNDLASAGRYQRDVY